ncbi:MAG: hypothetical protein KF837_18885 [Labilithrix sp.]|nr:hypothetical protein [Labilithrix sp.]
MANDLPRHFQAPALGMPRTPRAVSFSLPTSEDLIEVAEPALPFTESDAYHAVSPVLPRMVSAEESRLQPTVRVGGRSFRKGAEAPTKSSLAFFVLIGLFVGLCAFVAMTIALPDASAHAKAPAHAKPPTTARANMNANANTNAERADANAKPAVAITAPETVIASDSEASTASAKPTAARRRTPFIGKRTPNAKTVALPANPYKLP